MAAGTGWSTRSRSALRIAQRQRLLGNSRPRWRNQDAPGSDTGSGASGASGATGNGDQSEVGPGRYEVVSSTARQRADAFIEAIINPILESGHLPTCGGTPASVVVTIPWPRLADPLTPISADTIAEHVHTTTMTGTTCTTGTNNGPGHHLISTTTATALSCDATIQRVLLNPAGKPLDIGRRTRVIPEQIRTALAIRDQGCQYPLCTKPVGWTEGHHIQHWSNGGSTSLSNLILLCSRHHHQVHHDNTPITHTPDGIPRIHPTHTYQTPQHSPNNPWAEPADATDPPGQGPQPERLTPEPLNEVPFDRPSSNPDNRAQPLSHKRYQIVRRLPAEAEPPPTDAEPPPTDAEPPPTGADVPPTPPSTQHATRKYNRIRRRPLANHGCHHPSRIRPPSSTTTGSRAPAGAHGGRPRSGHRHRQHRNRCRHSHRYSHPLRRTHSGAPTQAHRLRRTGSGAQAQAHRLRRIGSGAPTQSQPTAHRSAVGREVSGKCNTASGVTARARS